jgi:APA family basic amino acid/polyamine antiporter
VPRLTRAHQVPNAQLLLGFEIAFNFPAFLIALVITAILVIGIKESARFNAGIVIMKVAVVVFVLVLEFKYVHPANWGDEWAACGGLIDRLFTLLE